jgi:hypothetical protein
MLHKQIASMHLCIMYYSLETYERKKISVNDAKVVRFRIKTWKSASFWCYTHGLSPSNEMCSEEQKNDL